jgi:ABC-type transport system substrate-binding protein
MQRRRRAGIAGPPHRAAGRRAFLRMLARAGGAGAVSAILVACRGVENTPLSATTTRGAITGPQPAARLAATQALRLPTIEPQRADPGTAVLSYESRVVMALYDGLLTYDGDGRAVPLVAETWDVSGDGLTYTFHLRDGVRWTDGRPVTAGDFEYAWKGTVN